MSVRPRTWRRGCKEIAKPNMVVIAEGTRKLVGNLFDLQNLGAKDLKGIAGPVRRVGYAAIEFGRRSLRGTTRERH